MSIFEQTESFNRSEEDWETHLLIDALYFHAARQAHSRAIKTQKKIVRTEKKWASLEAKEERILAKHNNDQYEASDELEPVYIDFSNVHYEIGESYAPLLKEVATVHILTTATLEAFINKIAKLQLKGKNLDHFEKISIEAKWLFLPKILGLPGFELGKQPFQRFSNLMKYRNNLVHYKGLKEKWEFGGVPKFIRKLGLTLHDSEDSIKAVQELTKQLSQQLGYDDPYWLRSDLNEMSYFDLANFVNG